MEGHPKVPEQVTIEQRERDMAEEGVDNSSGRRTAGSYRGL